MVSILQNVAIDCADAYELARFWSSVTGRPLEAEAGPGDRETLVLTAEGSTHRVLQPGSRGKEDQESDPSVSASRDLA